ncbi:MAG: hypothetical protein ACKVS6_06780 [Planctomycetota bacterium]
MLASKTTNRNGRLCAAKTTLTIAILIFGFACSAGPSVRPVSIRYVGAAGATPVSAAAVEVVKGKELRPHDRVAELSIPTDGSSFEALVQRLREKAGALGADAVTEVISVYDTPSGLSSTSSNTDLSQDAAREAAKVGLTLLVNRPKWVAVRGVAVRLHSRHQSERSFTVHKGTDSRPSPQQDAHRAGVPIAKTSGPGERPPVKQP